MLLARIDASLSSLEPERADPDLTETVFRSAHTLKGAAAALALDDIRDLALALERAFASRTGGSVGEALLQAATTATLLMREMLCELGRSSDPLRAVASQARDHLTRFAAPGDLEAGTLPEAASGASVRCQEALR
ncbi:Hpt domain-containing protein [Niveibacterium terrae]|uniref:Hpt domain-containing protein n=1 Tax=Niveibacterium terrae TaxID=3373598 RepID=UPI003A8E67B2